jgi:hypothetical protein
MVRVLLQTPYEWEGSYTYVTTLGDLCSVFGGPLSRWNFSLQLGVKDCRKDTCRINKIAGKILVGCLSSSSVFKLGKKSCVNKNQGWEPIHQKYRANENTNKHKKKEANNQPKSGKDPVQRGFIAMK